MVRGSAIALEPLSWLDIAPALVKALHGDLSGFAPPPPPGPPPPPDYGGRAITCLDWPVQVHNFAQFEQRVTYARLLAPHMGGCYPDLAGYLGVRWLAAPAA